MILGSGRCPVGLASVANQSNTLIGVPLLLSDATFAHVYGLGAAPLEQVQADDGTVDFLHTGLIGSVRSTTDATG
ncbi:hypothetical protein ACTHAM_001081 [Cellulomonas soli]|uniref:hypothetical protein n=1 Tax=Cellulomonas soli TaxID=931535 RepID=UPI003F83D6C0